MRMKAEELGAALLEAMRWGNPKNRMRDRRARILVNTLEVELEVVSQDAYAKGLAMGSRGNEEPALRRRVKELEERVCELGKQRTLVEAIVSGMLLPDVARDLPEWARLRLAEAVQRLRR